MFQDSLVFFFCSHRNAIFPDACSVVSDHLYLLEEWKMTGEMPSLGMSVRGTHEPTYVTTQSAHGRGGRMGGSAEHVLNSVQEEIKGKLKNVLRKKSFHGYPINIAFTDVNMVVEKVALLSLFLMFIAVHLT